jgi:DNA-binding NarL/FixJ family response regulator
MVFILLFYVFGGFVPIYMRYKSDFSKLLAEGEINESFDGFCKKYEISKREKEIIHEICKGLSNQQIADRLFISLQTVKDHTHRIYGKTNCISRAQLIRMVNDNVLEILPDTHAG